MSRALIEVLLGALGETLLMVLTAGSIGFALGIPLGVLLFVWHPGRIAPRPHSHTLLSALVNALRSVPFIILLVAIIPLTRLLVGTAKFVEGVGKAIEWTRQTSVSEVQARLEQIVKKRNRNEDASLLRYWRPSAATLPAGLLADDQFQIWIDWLVRGKQLERGRVKASDVYTNRFNPWRKSNP